MTTEQQNVASQTTWRYSTAGERLRETAAGVGGLALYTIGLSQVFNPLVVAGLVGYAAAKTGLAYYGMTRDNAAEGLLKAGYILPLEEKHRYLQKIVDDAVNVAGMKPHTAYIATDKLLRTQTPWYMRWLLKNEAMRKKMLENIAAAMSTSDIAMFSKEFIDKYSTAEERFVALHEMGHCATEDSFSPQSVSRVFTKIVKSPVFYGMAGLFGLAALGAVGLPVGAASVPVLAAGVGLWKATGILALASGASALALNYGSRVAEYRADRNAVYFGRSAEAGINFLREAHGDGKEPSRTFSWLPDTQTHPSYHNRVANIEDSWKRAASHPVPRTVTPESEIAEMKDEKSRRTRTVLLKLA